MQKLINNGLPDGLKFKDVVEGDILEIGWYVGDNEIVVVINNNQSHRRATYQGEVEFKVMSDRRHLHQNDQYVLTINGDQVVRKLGSIWDRLSYIPGAYGV